MNLSLLLLAWYDQNARRLPWRGHPDPYAVWVSEIMLQQTRVEAVIPYFENWMRQFPNLQALAEAPLPQVLRVWEGLGYYSRAKNMLHTASFLHTERASKFPNSYNELLKLKGVGKYTAAAIASFALQEKVAVLDGNVFRVLARYFGVETPINSTKGQKEFEELSQRLVPEKNSDLYNQAIMEFGALQCTPQKPTCMYCPLQATCLAFANRKQGDLPIKIGKIKIKERFFAYIVGHFEGKIAMKKRQEKDIWENLYDFHLEELSSLAELENFENKKYREFGDCQKVSGIYKHQLSHQRIYVKFFHFELSHSHREKMPENLYFWGLDDLKKIPKPILIANYLEKEFF